MIVYLLSIIEKMPKIIQTILVVSLIAALCLYKIESDGKSVSLVSYDFDGINSVDLFQSVTYPGTVDKWFRWISHFRSADHKPIGVGKMFKTFFNGEIIVLQVSNYSPDEMIVLESDSLLKPRIELRAMPITERTSRLIVSLTFRRSSALFKLSIEPILLELSRQKIQEAVSNLKKLLKHRSKTGLERQTYFVT